MDFLPDVPIGDWGRAAVDWARSDASAVLNFIRDTFNTATSGLADGLMAVPPLVAIIVFTLIALLVRSWIFAIFTLLSMALIENMGLWNPAMQTLALIMIATFVILVIAIPVGILAARSRPVSVVVKPILDFMQTMPALVYLIPMVLLFRIGFAPGVVATIIFAAAPGVRLTELAIRQVDKETVEAGEAFGGTPRQILRGIQLPLGLPTIMAGVNQVIMLGLSMAVMAGFVGAPGLGERAVAAMSGMNVEAGFEAGLAIVILAIFLDRLTSAIGQPTKGSLLAMLKKSRTSAARDQEKVEAAEKADHDAKSSLKQTAAR